MKMIDNHLFCNIIIFCRFRMEEMFEKDDLKKLTKYLGIPDNSSYSNIMTFLICSEEKIIEEINNIISKETKHNFQILYKLINSVYKNN